MTMRRPPPALAAEWRQRLKDDGFDDHEDPSGRLRTVGPQRGVDPVTLMEGNGHWLRSAEYHDLLLAAMHAPSFTQRWSPRQRQVLELHAEGRSYRDIRRVTGCGHGFDTATVAAFRREVGIRE